MFIKSLCQRNIRAVISPCCRGKSVSAQNGSNCFNLLNIHIIASGVNTVTTTTKGDAQKKATNYSRSNSNLLITRATCVKPSLGLPFRQST